MERITRRDFLKYCGTGVLAISEFLSSPKTVIIGRAHWYSTEQCLGCSKGLETANGDLLDNTRKTIACNLLELDTVVTVTSLETGNSTTAIVTDRGEGLKQNFYDDNIVVADLTLATAKAIEMDLKRGHALVKIEAVKEI